MTDVNCGEMDYLGLLGSIRNTGEFRPDRTGVGTRSRFSPLPMEFYMSDGFPLLTTKNINFNIVKDELLWFLSGSTNVNDLHSHIWSNWADENGDLGPVYGAQWRGWGGEIDQIARVIESIKTDPFSRRHIVSAWNVGELDKMALPPCHAFMQFYVSTNRKDNKPRYLSLHLYQRSGDMFLGVPFNIAEYALLLHMVAAQTGLFPRRFIHTIGDAHIYTNHFDQVDTQRLRTPYPFPELWLNPDVKSIFDYTPDDIEILGYQHHGALFAPVAV